MKISNRTRYGWYVLLGVAALALLLRPLRTVGSGERAVLFSLFGGTQTRQLGEGTHFVMPLVQSAVYYDVRTQTYTMSATSWEGEVKGDDSLSALTSDGQEVKVDLSVRYHPDPKFVWRLHQRVGQDYANKIIRPAARSETRITIAQFPIADVYANKRALVQQRLTDALRRQLAANDIILDEVLLRDLRFSDAYARAIEAKQIAQQDAQRLTYTLQKAEKDKQRRILEAQGDAIAIELKGQAIAQSSRIVQYEYARKIAPNVRAIITDGKNLNVPFGAK